MASLTCVAPCGRSLQLRSAFKSRQPGRPANLIVRSQIPPAQAARQARDATASLMASFTAAAMFLALPANAAAPTLFDSGSTYQQELQDLVDKRGGLQNFTPPESVKKAAEKASNAADSAKFKLDNVTKGSIDTPDVLDKALPEAAKNLPSPSLPSADVPTPKFEAPKFEAPKIEVPKLETPKFEAPTPPKLETPSLPSPPKVQPLDLPSPPKVEAPSAPELPQQSGGGLPTPYLAAGGVAALAIVGIGLAGAKPDTASPAVSGNSGGGSSSSGSGASVPEGKDPELDSDIAKKKDPFFKEVDKRTS